jgi:methylmalonyl-CoA mutase N-terminal domain/subunit
MYRGRLWTVRQFAGYGDPEETNKRFKYLLEHGQNGLSVAFDMPTLMGLDSDSPLSLGEVGTRVWPLIRWRTWSGSSTGFPWVRSRPP